MRSASPTEVPPNFWTTNAMSQTLMAWADPSGTEPAPGPIEQAALGRIGSPPVPSEKRSRQRAAREERLAAEAKSQKRRKQIRNVIIVVVLGAVVIGIVALVSHNN